MSGREVEAFSKAASCVWLRSSVDGEAPSPSRAPFHGPSAATHRLGLGPPTACAPYDVGEAERP